MLGAVVAGGTYPPELLGTSLTAAGDVRRCSTRWSRSEPAAPTCSARCSRRRETSGGARDGGLKPRLPSGGARHAPRGGGRRPEVLGTVVATAAAVRTRSARVPRRRVPVWSDQCGGFRMKLVISDTPRRSGSRSERVGNGRGHRPAALIAWLGSGSVASGTAASPWPTGGRVEEALEGMFGALSRAESFHA